MFSHMMVGSNDIALSRQFYDAIWGALGYEGEPAASEGPTGNKRLFYSHNGGAFGVGEPVDGQPATHANGGTIGFACKSGEEVMAWHAAGVANGGTSIEGDPGPRETEMGVMHLAYLRDPDGKKLCAVYREG